MTSRCRRRRPEVQPKSLDGIAVPNQAAFAWAAFFVATT
jgi:hypothetical protein